MRGIKLNIVIVSFFVLISSLSYAFAHHSFEYIGMDGYTTAQKGEFVFRLLYDYIVEDKDNPSVDRWELTPGLAYGITDRLMFDFHTHFAKFGYGHVVEEKQENYKPLGPSPFIEAGAFALQYRLTEGWLVDVAVSGLYEIPFGRSKELLDGKEVYEGTLIVSKGLGTHSNVCLNFTYGRDGDKEIKEFALGVRTPISYDPHGVAISVEFLGEIEEGKINWFVLPGLSFPLGSESTIFRSGLGFGENMNNMRTNITIIHRF